MTGATATSAAGALLDHGAESVTVLPIARHLSKAFWRGHSYLGMLEEPYRVEIWPRGDRSTRDGWPELGRRALP